MLRLRRPNVDDIPAIEDIADKYSNNPLPNNFADAAVIEKNNEIVSFGVTRYILEALLYADGSDRDKVESLKALIRQAKTDAITRDSDSIYVFAQDEQFARILERHFSFRRLISIPMILEIK